MPRQAQDKCKRDLNERHLCAQAKAAAGMPAGPHCYLMGSVGTETFLRCHFILKTIFLPRQARDKHRETALKTKTRFPLGRGRTINERTRNTSVCISRNNNDDNVDDNDKQRTNGVAMRTMRSSQRSPSFNGFPCEIQWDWFHFVPVTKR